MSSHAPTYGSLLRSVVVHAGHRTFMLLLTLVWIGFVVYLGSISRVPQPPVATAWHLSSLAHYAVHLLLAGLLYLLVSPTEPNATRRVVAALVAAGCSAGLGLAIEGLQLLVPDRAAEISDAVFNAAGALTGVVGLYILEYLGCRRQLLSATVGAVAVIAIAVAGIGAVVWDPISPS